MRRSVTLAIVLVLVGSLIAPIAIASTSSSGPPSGMVGVPDYRVGPPDHAPAAGGPPNDQRIGPPSHAKIPTEAAAWSIHSTKHAGDLDVTIGEIDGQLALEIRDDVNHDGRTIALDRSALRSALGYEPIAANGVHSSGEEWTDEIEYRGEYALIEIEKFSSNTVTFGGEVSLTGSPAADGTTFSYDLDSTDDISNFTVDLEGDTHLSDERISRVTSSPATESIVVGGSLDPTGYNGKGSPTLSATGAQTVKDDDSAFEQTGAETGRLNDPPGFTELRVTARCTDCSNDINARFDVATDSGHYSDGYIHGVPGDGSETTFTITDVPKQDNPGAWVEVSEYYFSETVEILDIDAISEYPSDANATIDGTEYVLSSGEFNSSTSKDVSLATSTDSVAFDWLGQGEIDWSLEFRAGTETIDPTIDVNGNSTGYTGTLADGETTSLSVDPAWIQTGTNTVNVTVAPTVSGPDGHVGLDYSHTAKTDQSVDYTSETWSERYNISRSWDSATENATVTIPFASDRVVAIRETKMRVDGGSWQTLGESDVSLNGTEMTAQLGSVEENQTVEVVTTGSKVKVRNGEISVIEPTVDGNSLDTKIEIVEHSDSFAIAVGGTSEGEYLHHTWNESWTAPETSTVIDATGGQEIHAPGASTGSTTRVSTIPLEIAPNAGEIEIDLLDDGSEPRLSVDPRNGASEVEYVWHDTVSGDKYVLYSETHGIARDSATANSPVTLLSAAYEETLTILHDDGSSGDGSSIAGGSGGAGPIATAAGANPLLVLIVGVGLIGGMAIVAQRTRLPMTIVAGVGILVGILSIEIVAPGSISGAISSTVVMVGSGLGEVAAPVALILVGTLAYLAVRWWQARQTDAATPDTQVTFSLGDRGK